MFGLFKKKPTPEEFDAAKADGSVYPGESISVLSIQTESGRPATAWVNQAYRGYKFKSFCPSFLNVKLAFGELDEDIDMATIEDHFEERLKQVGVAHFIGRFVTDEGMDMLFYTEPNEGFSDAIDQIAEEEEFNVNISLEYAPDDSKWRSMKMVLG